MIKTKTRPNLNKEEKRKETPNLQSKNDPTQARTEYHFNRPPLLPRQHIQITRKRNPRQQIRKEHIDGAGEDELVEDFPVGDVARGKIFEVLAHETEGREDGW